MTKFDPPVPRDQDATGPWSILDCESSSLFGLLDPTEVFRAIAADVPPATGLEVAWIGVPQDGSSMVLHYFQGTRVFEAEGLVVPIGLGLGGQVLASGRPCFVPNYVASHDITHHFDPEVEAEGLRGMIAVPIEYAGRSFGVLYGSNRSTTAFGGKAIKAMQLEAKRAATAAAVAERARHAAEVAILEERHRLALDLHDSVGAMLFAITAGVRSVGEDLDALPELRRRLDAIEGQAMEAAKTLRLSLTTLSSSPEDLALAVALRADARAFEDRANCPTRVIVLTDLPPLKPTLARALIDSVREALLNVGKHANARSVVLTAAATQGGVIVAVADDGEGLAPATSDGTSGLGLRAAADRLGRLGGRLNVTENEEGGVTFRAWVPC